MPRSTDSREKIVRSAARLFQRDGYAATGWRRIVDEADAPWGSQHHHFPGGKVQLAEEAVDLSGAAYRDLLVVLLEERRPADAVRVWSQVAARELEASGFADGCPIATVALETAHSTPALALAADRALTSWRDAWADALAREGYGVDDRRELATLIIAAIEGALVLARAANDVSPIEDVGRAVAACLDARADANRSV